MPFQVRGRDYAQPIPIGMIPPYQSPMMQPSIWGQTLGNPQLQNVLMNLGSSMMMAGAPAPVSAGPPGYRLAQGMAALPGQMQQFQQFQNEQERFRLQKMAAERDLQEDLQTKEGQRAMAEALGGIQTQNPLVNSMIGAFAKNPQGLTPQLMQSLVASTATKPVNLQRAIINLGNEQVESVFNPATGRSEVTDRHLVQPSPSTQMSQRAADERSRLTREAAQKRLDQSISAQDARANLTRQNQVNMAAGRELLVSLKEDQKTQKAYREQENFVNGLFRTFSAAGGGAQDLAPRLVSDFMKIDPTNLSPQSQLKHKLIAERAQAYNIDPKNKNSAPFIGPYFRSGDSYITMSKDGTQLEDAGPGFEGAIAAVQLLDPAARREFLAGGNTLVQDRTTGMLYTFDRKWGTLRPVQVDRMTPR